MPEGHFADPPALTKPFLWIEYAHAMGNGAGSLKEYMALTEKHPALHGGFIWEWIDHGLETADAEGNRIYGYGGDFGERLHDGNFVADGLVLPDRTPSPALLDAKHHYSPVGLEVSPGTARIVNRYAFSDLSHLRAEVSVDAQASWQELELPTIAPGESVEVALPAHEGATTTVRLLTREAQGPVPAGHTIVAADHVDPARLRAALTPSAAAAAAPEQGEDGSWSLGPARFDDLGRLGVWAISRSRAPGWICTARRWTTSGPAPAPRSRRAGSGSAWTTPGAVWWRSPPRAPRSSCAAGSGWTARRWAPTSPSASAVTPRASTWT